MKIIYKTILALGQMTLLASIASADIVYDNTTTRSNPHRFAQSGFEFGEEIILAGQGAWTVNNFQYEFFGYGPDFTDGKVSVRLRFYRNDGASGTPKSLLYDSGPSPIPPTGDEGNVLEYADLSVLVPKSFTWTVEFTGLGKDSEVGLQSTGLDLYQFPIVGQTYDDFWERSGPGGGWVLRAPKVGQPPINFGCRVSASFVGRPEITVHPESVETCEGDTVVLAVTAIGTPKLTYQWFKDNKAIPKATTSTLALPNATAADVGDYSVQVSNGTGTALSLVAHVSIKSPTLIPGVVVYDNTANIEEPPLYLTNQVEFGDEITLAEGDSWRITSFQFAYVGFGFASGEVKLTLRFYENDGLDGNPGTKLYDSGSHAAHPTEDEGTTLEFVGLDVIVPQTFTWTVQFTGVGASGLAGLIIAEPPTTGSSSADYWRRVGPSEGATWELQSPTKGAGPSTFYARAATGVSPPLAITQEPQSVEVCSGDPAMLKVVATAETSPSYQWYFNKNEIAGATQDTLTIAVVDLADLGSYTVVVKSCLTSLESAAATISVPESKQHAPCLKIEVGDDKEATIVSWTSFFGSQWILHQASKLDAPEPWLPTPFPPSLVEGRYVVSVPARAAAENFILVHP